MFVPTPRSSVSADYSPEYHDVIISDSVILQASRLLSGEATGVGGLLDLAALVEAVVLNEHLLYLGDMSHSVFNSLPLGRLLINEGIVRGYAPDVSTKDVQDSVFRLFGIPEAYEKMNLSPIIARQETSGVLPYYGDYDYFAPDEAGMVLAELDLAQKLPPFSLEEASSKFLPDSLPYYCFSLVEMWAGDNVWARRPAQAFLIRTLVYWVLADLLNISFYPDFTRLAIVAQITHQLSHSQGRGAFDLVAKAFYIPAEDLAWTNLPFEVPIPPFTRVLLERIDTIEEIGEGLIELRKVFQDLRSAIGQYQYTLRNATRLSELWQGRQNLVRAGAEAAEKFDQPEIVRIQETTSYHQQELKIGQQPRDPEAYSRALMFQPVEWVREWWLRRHAIHLFDAGSKLANIDAYYNLARLKLGIELDMGQSGIFLKADDLMRKMYFQPIRP